MKDLSKDMWSEAAKAGLVLGGVSVLYLVISYFTSMISGGVATAFIASVLNIVLWAAKFFGCIYLMKFFLQSFHDKHQDMARAFLRRYGMMIALLSAIVYSGCYLFYEVVVAQDMMNEAFDIAMEQYSTMLDAESLEYIQNMRADMPTISFFTNLIYCFIFGTVLSAIISGRMISDNPFASGKKSEDDED